MYLQDQINLIDNKNRLKYIVSFLGKSFKKLKKIFYILLHLLRGLVGNKLRAIFEIKGDFQKLRAIYSLLNPTEKI
jgi:hypothetical protein